MTSQPSVLRPQAQPIGQLLRGSPVLSGESVRRVVRSYFVSSGFTSVLVLGMPCSSSVPSSKPGHHGEILEGRRTADGTVEGRSRARGEYVGQLACTESSTSGRELFATLRAIPTTGPNGGGRAGGQAPVDWSG